MQRHSMLQVSTPCRGQRNEHQSERRRRKHGEELTWAPLEDRLGEVLQAGEQQQRSGSQQQEEPQGAAEGAGRLHGRTQQPPPNAQQAHPGQTTAST